MEEINLVINALFNWFKQIFVFVYGLHPVFQASFYVPLASLVVYIFFKFLGKDKGI